MAANDRESRRGGLRVGVITTSYPRYPGDAAGHFVATLNHWLNQQGIDVEVLCAAEEEPLFYRGGAPSQLEGVTAWMNAIAWVTRLSRVAQKHAKRWDGIVSHWLLPSGMVADSVTGRGVPHLAIAHGSDIALAKRLPFATTWIRSLAQRADLVYVAKALVVDGAPGRVVPMGVALEDVVGGDGRFAPIEIRGGKVALILSRLVDDKGIDTVLGRMPPGVTLVVAGEGPERARLEQLASRGRYPVELIGAVEGEAKRNLLDRADVLIVPSRRDGAPTVIAEAAAVGLPVVANAVGGIPELPMRGLFLVENSNFESAIAAALAHGRVAPPPRTAWPNQAAQAELLFRPFLTQLDVRRGLGRNATPSETNPAPNCCQTVTVRI